MGVFITKAIFIIMTHCPRLTIPDHTNDCENLLYLLGLSSNLKAIPDFFKSFVHVFMKKLNPAGKILLRVYRFLIKKCRL
jgi:hypothetical protein